MARRKRTSIAVDKAERRAAGLEAISADLDLGNGMSLSEFRKCIQEVYDSVNTYNRMLSTVDQLYNDMMAKEKTLSDMTARMLAAVAVVYGRSSSEYEVAGGSRRGESRRSKVAVVSSTEATTVG
jgi:glutamyl-tRNA reductase